MRWQRYGSITNTLFRYAWVLVNVVFVRIILISVLMIACSSALARDCSRLIASGNAEYPPYLWRASQTTVEMHGAIPQLMDYVAKQLKIDIEVKYLGPWGRVQEEVAEGNIDLLSGAFYTEPRSYRMDYIQPSFQRTQTSVWVHKDRLFKFDGWSDLVGKSGVTVINNSFGQTFDQYAATHLNIHQAGRLSQGLRMLLGERVDYFLYEDLPARAYAAELGMLENIKPLENAVSSEDLFLTVSKRSPCNTPELRAELTKALEQAQQQGVMQQFLQQALELWQTRAPG